MLALKETQGSLASAYNYQIKHALLGIQKSEKNQQESTADLTPPLEHFDGFIT
jgi:hypothetical protein